MRSKALLLLAMILPSLALGLLSNADRAYLEQKNLLLNPNAQGGRTGWTASGGTFTITTTAANVVSGGAGFSFTPSAGSQTVTSTQYTLPAGLFGTNCLAKIRYKTAEGTNQYVLNAIDGSSNVLGTVTLAASTVFRNQYASFICPSSGTVAFQVAAASSTPSNPIFWGESWLGSNYLIANISQAQFAGSAFFAGTASCIWTSPNSTTLQAFGTTAACPGPTLETTNLGVWQTTDADLPQITINALPPGLYEVKVQFTASGGATGAQLFTINDGTTSSGTADFGFNSAAAVNQTITLVGHFSYTTAGNKTFALWGATFGTSAQVLDRVGEGPLRFSITRFPLSQETSVRFDQVGWFVDATLSGNSISLGGANVASLTDIAASNLSLAAGAKSIPVQIACANTFDSTGTICDPNNEVVGVTFTNPQAGSVIACVTAQHVLATASGAVDGAYYIVETTPTSSTSVQTGPGQATFGTGNSTVTLPQVQTPVRFCSLLTFSSVARRTLRLQYKQVASGTVSTNFLMVQDSNSGQQLHWEVYPVTNSWPMPALVGGVSSNTSGQERVERLTVSSTCSSTPCTIASQSGSWVSSITRTGAGSYTVNFTAGEFSAAPTCVFLGTGNTNSWSTQTSAYATTSSVGITCVNQSSALADCSFSIICMGPK